MLFFAGVPGKVRGEPPGNHQLQHGKSDCSPESPHVLHIDCIETEQHNDFIPS